MGYGDALMAAGQAEEIYAADPALGPVALCDVNGRARWNPVWLYNPAVWVPGSMGRPSRLLASGAGALPYLHHPYSVSTGWRFTDWCVRDHRPSLYLHQDEIAWGDRLLEQLGPFIVFEPTAERKHVNRRPPRPFWGALVQQLRAALPDVPLVQLLHADAVRLPGTIPFPHATFRDACGVLKRTALLVCTEGGLAHAAAALDVQAVVLWGGNVSEPNLGYPEHVNVVDPDAQTPCGSLVVCDHCTQAWARLTPEIVTAAVVQEWTQNGLSRSRRTAVR